MTTPDDQRQPPLSPHTLSQSATEVEDATDILLRLSALAALARAVDQATRVAVTDARAQGISWTAIGGSLRTSKQAAAKRFKPQPKHEQAPQQAASTAEQHGEEPNTNTTAETRRQKSDHRLGWDVTTRRGRTLIRIVPRRQR